MKEKEEPVVVTSFKKKETITPVFVAEGKKAEYEPVILKYDLGKNEEKKGFYVDMPKLDLTSVALKNMADETKSYLKNEGYSIKDDDLKCFISSLTSRLIYIPLDDFPESVLSIAKYFTGSVYYAESPNDASILKCLYSACCNPKTIHFLLWKLKPNVPMPEYLVRYINFPSSSVEMIMNEYINESYIGKVRLTDNIFVIICGNIDLLEQRLKRQYVIFNPRWKRVEKENVGFKSISLNSFKNMYKVMDVVSDSLWTKVSQIEDILTSMKITLENKDYNHLDDYLVTLVNQGIDENQAIIYLIENRLFPMMAKEVLEELKRRLNEVGLYSGRENS